MEQVSRVLYPGLEGHPYYPRVHKLFGGQAGGVVTFELLGGAAAAEMMFQVCFALGLPQTKALHHSFDVAWLYILCSCHAPKQALACHLFFHSHRSVVLACIASPQGFTWNAGQPMLKKAVL